MGSQAPALARPIVIIVDDDAAVRASLKFALEIEGFSVHAYGRADELFADRSLAACACFVIDEKLPGMNGMELVTVLRRQHMSAPVILITSAPPRGLQERAAAAGIPIVEKPLLGNTLLDRIRAATANSASSH
jgi:FixJ family two-component response regulator